MDIRKKILLGNKDILSRNLEDFYVDINLSRDNKEIIPYKYDNIFDLTKFYDQERNESRNFIIYGAIDSYSWNCDNLKITVYQSPSLSSQDYLCTTYSNHIINKYMPFMNIYSKLRGKYIINNIPITFSGCSVWLKIETLPPNDYIEYVVNQQLIFTTLTLNQTGKKIVEQLKYGLNEAVTDCDGNVTEINNDFDFFYNKHWIKKNLHIIDESTKWIGNENTKTCEMSNALFRGRNVGVYNTGNHTFGEVIEVYKINEQPTGKAEENIPSSLNYIAPFPSNGACPIPEEYTFNFHVVLTPTNDNTFTTAPINNVKTEVFPNDTLFREGEVISGANLNTSSYWNFEGFAINNKSITTTDETFKISIRENTVIRAIMSEITPYSIIYTKDFINCSGVFTPGINSVPIIDNLVPDRKKYYNGEPVSFSVLQRIEASTFPYRLTLFTINGIEQKIYPTQLGGQTFNFTMTEDKIMYFKYEQGTILIVKQKFMPKSPGGHPTFYNSIGPTVKFIGVNQTNDIIFDEKFGDQFKSAGCNAEFKRIECVPGDPIPDENGGYIVSTTGWTVNSIRKNGENLTFSIINNTLPNPPDNPNVGAIIMSPFPTQNLLDFNSSDETVVIEIIWQQDGNNGIEYD
jgi:hypothetical protein